MAPGVRQDDDASDKIHSLFRERLRSAREGQGLSQQTLAETAGLKRSTVANIEGGRQRVTLDVLVGLAKALRVDPSRLLPTLAELDTDAATPAAVRERVASSGGASATTEKALLSLLKPKPKE